jgi:hypothetical protein
MGKCNGCAVLVAGLLVIVGTGYSSNSESLIQSVMSSEFVSELSQDVRDAFQRKLSCLDRPEIKKQQKQYKQMLDGFPSVPSIYRLVQNETETVSSDGIKLVRVSEEGSSELTQDQLSSMVEKIKEKMNEYRNLEFDQDLAIYQAYNEKLSQKDIERLVEAIK